MSGIFAFVMATAHSISNQEGVNTLNGFSSLRLFCLLLALSKWLIFLIYIDESVSFDTSLIHLHREGKVTGSAPKSIVIDGADNNAREERRGGSLSIIITLYSTL